MYNCAAMFNMPGILNILPEKQYKVLIVLVMMACWGILLLDTVCCFRGVAREVRGVWAAPGGTC